MLCCAVVTCCTDDSSSGSNDFEPSLQHKSNMPQPMIGWRCTVENYNWFHLWRKKEFCTEGSRLLCWLSWSWCDFPKLTFDSFDLLDSFDSHAKLLLLQHDTSSCSLPTCATFGKNELTRGSMWKSLMIKTAIEERHTFVWSTVVRLCCRQESSQQRK